MDYKENLHKAKQELSTADYIATITTAVIRDKNVLLNIFSHADNAVLLALNAFLTYQKELKQLKMIPASEELQRQIFFDDYANLLNMTGEEKRILNELKDIVYAHKKNQIEIKRGDDYIIVLTNYKTVTVNRNSIIKYLSVARGFINRLEGLLK